MLLWITVRRISIACYKRNAILHLHKKQSYNESRTLAVAHFAIMKAIRFHNVKQTLLTKTIFFLKEVMLRICSRYISPDYPLAGGRRFDILCELLFYRRIVSTAQQLPDDTPKMVLHLSMSKLTTTTSV